jgi:hypothetical protein
MRGSCSAFAKLAGRAQQAQGSKPQTGYATGYKMEKMQKSGKKPIEINNLEFS